MKEVSHDEVTEGTFEFVSRGGVIRDYPPQRNGRVLTVNYRTLEVPAANRQETAMSRIIDELVRRDLY